MESFVETSHGRLAVVTHEAPQSQGWFLSLHPIHRWLHHRPQERQRLLARVDEFLAAGTRRIGT